MAAQPQQIATPEYRKQALEYCVAHLVRQGYRVVSQTDTTAQLVRPKGFSCLWATLWFLLFGIGLLVYVFYYMGKEDDVAYVSIDQWGRGHITCG